MAPEYAMRGHYSIKSDVFSFGVLILEIVTGRKNNVSYDSEQSVDLLSLVSTSGEISYYKLYTQVMCCINIRTFTYQKNAGVGTLVGRNSCRACRFIHGGALSWRPDLEVRPHRTPVCSRRPHGETNDVDGECDA